MSQDHTRLPPTRGEGQGQRSGAGAKEIVREVLLGVLPPETPPSFREIVRAVRQGRGRAAEIEAELIMVDGLPATVRLRPWAYGWSHRFTEMPGGPLSFEDGQWVRGNSHEG